MWTISTYEIWSEQNTDAIVNKGRNTQAIQPDVAAVLTLLKSMIM